MLNNDHESFAAAQARAAAAVSCESVVLPSGLTVLCRTMPGYSSVHAIYATGFGSVHRAFRLDGKQVTLPAGTAHFLEHKMCETPKGDSFTFYAKTGASANAFTSYDRTCYLFSATQKIDENLDILLGMVGKPWFTKATIAKEQGIIGQEIRMIEDNPDWQIYTRMLRALYHNHAARTSIAGTVESISHITADTLYNCHKAFYTPANMILTVVGDVDPIHVADLANRVLPKLSGPVIERDYGEEPETVAEKETVMEMEVSAPQFLAGFKCAPAAEGSDYMRANILGDLACDILLGDSSPLYQRLYEQGLINPSFGGAYEMLPGVAYLYAGGDSRDANAVTDAILQEAERLAAEGVDEAYFQRIRKASFGANLRGLNSFENIAVTLTEGYFHGYDPLRFPEVFDSITAEDIAAFLKTNVTAEHMVLSRIVPKQ